MPASFYWHDYETWGATPSVDRPSQFAGVRTDEDLNITGEPLVIYCKPPGDILPQPEACLVTGITPQKAEIEGLTEAEFITRIHDELSQPQTCTVGYNSLRFDDEVTRYSLYRNFFDPYEREWRNGNSRWDIIDMLRTVYALRPEGIEWPVVDSKPSFKLELLTEANGISHASAHDAFSDVEATIALARLVRARKPELYDYVLRNKSKQSLSRMINIAQKKPLLHISSKFPAARGCAGLVVPLAAHPTNTNAVIVYELSVDPTPLEALSAEQLAERVFAPASDLPEGCERLPIKLIHLNKCPILLPTKAMDTKLATRLSIDKSACERHWRMLLNMEVEYKLREMFKLQAFQSHSDPERMLYDGFISDDDKAIQRDLRSTDPALLGHTQFVFQDQRLNEMLLGYKARNFPEVISEAERLQWEEFKRHRLLHGEPGMLSLNQFRQRIISLSESSRSDESAQKILRSLTEYADQIEAQIR